MGTFVSFVTPKVTVSNPPLRSVFPGSLLFTVPSFSVTTQSQFNQVHEYGVLHNTHLHELEVLFTIYETASYHELHHYHTKLR
jgi:hypothetical protein